MKHNNTIQYIKAVVVTLIFGVFSTVTQAQGPNAPEAASFEPVDATDMVNLVTGDLSYVLPLLNVPSPEGGYPLSLSYHAGIAMEQEASWVGLGWSLNPGAINRSVNGYPDDWGKTEVSELYYDEGGSTDYYSFSIGGTLPNGVTIGVSKSWGGYRAWGGIVTYAGNSIHFGSEGVGASASILGVTVSALPGQDVRTSIGLGQAGGSLGMLSGGATLDFDLNTRNIQLSGNAGLKIKQTGAGLSGRGFNFSINSALGSGGTLNSSSVNEGDYFVKTTEKGFNFDVGFYWARYRHTNVSYSLFKDNIIYSSGILNAFDYKLNTSFATIDDSYPTMDVKEFYADDKDYVINEIRDITKSTQLPSIMLPNYDNYSVSGQGVGGSISPRIYEEMTLSGKKLFEERNSFDNVVLRNYALNYHDQGLPNQDQFSLNNKIHFYFDNTVSSFLRTSSGSFDFFHLKETRTSPLTGEEYSDYVVRSVEDLLSVNTFPDNTYSSGVINDFIPTKSGEIKRDGNFIETFTNGDIINNRTNGWFIEAKSDEFYRLNDPNRFTNIKNEDGIGAYRITTLDGKVYHYSLPVYHYESIYKNFAGDDDENRKFFRSKKTKPYATHWLLTAITGPDYVDRNNNGKLDESDYGYWVEFEYGRWSDGFAWRSPKEGFKVYKNNKSYFTGLKEIYYLDKVKTRTHTALFIKSLRQDDKSFPLNIYKNKWNETLSIFDENVSEYFIDKQNKDYVVNGTVYPTNGINGGLQFVANNSSYNSHKKFVTTYMEVPENYSLKLDKILIVKNKDVVYDKTNPNFNNKRQVGYTYHNTGLKGVLGYRTFFNPIKISQTESYLPNKHFINMDNRILDGNDITLALREKAIKTISFRYDYSLSDGLPNSSSGHLTLKSVHTQGKSGIEKIPPYKFNYTKSNVVYDKENQDVWGYVKDNPDAWSLNKIITPLGSSVDIEYESDSFYAEAGYRTRGTSKNFRFNYRSSNSIITDCNIGSNYIELFFDVSKVKNLDQLVALGTPVKIYISRTAIPYYFWYKMRYTRDLSSYYTIESLDKNQNSIRFTTNELTNMDTHNELMNLTLCPVSDSILIPTGEEDFCISNIQFTIDKGFLTYEDSNGKKGGGIRVKSINVKEGVNSYKTTYNYNNPISNTISGITSYEPFEAQDKIVPYIEELPAPNVMYGNISVSSMIDDKVEGTIEYTFNTLTPFSITDQDDETELYRLGNEFQVVRNQYYSPNIKSLNTVYKHTIHNALSSIGSLISTKTYNSFRHLVSSTNNNYLEYDFNEQNIIFGTSQESFKTYKSLRDYYYHTENFIPNDPLRASYHRVTYSYQPFGSSKVNYPSVLRSTTVHKDGFTYNTEFDKHDFLTGQALETRTVDSKGREFRTELTPAYTESEYNPSSGYGMGAKVDDPSNKNMLTQEAMTKTYLKVGDQWKETGVGITTWNNDWTYRDYSGIETRETDHGKKIWRKHKTYVWDGAINSQDGSLSEFEGEDDNFNWDVGQNIVQENSKWQNISTTTRYDHFSMPLESKDINGNYVATKMTGGKEATERVLAVCNSKYTEMFYSGAEEGTNNPFLFSGEVAKGAVELDGIGPTSSKSHTGNLSLKLGVHGGFTVNLKRGEYRQGKYKLTVWIHKDDVSKARVSINDVANTFNGEIVRAGDWVMMNHIVNLNENRDYEVEIKSSTGVLYADDFMFRPIYSTITGYVYNQWDELWYIIGSTGLGSKFEYDAAGRLTTTYTEVADFNGVSSGGFKKITENSYHYKNFGDLNND